MAAPGGSGKVIVYILSADPKSDNALRVKSLFSNHLFSKVSIRADSASGKVDPSTQEYGTVKGCLRDAKDRFPDNYIIIIKDSSVSVASPDTLANLVQKAINMGGWDIFYLCAFQMPCDSVSEQKSLGGINVAKTRHAQGLQAVLLTPHARRILDGEAKMHNGEYLRQEGSVSDILTRAMMADGIRAFATFPNIINFDVSQAQSPADFQKANQCADKPVQSYQQVPGQAPAPLTPANSSNWAAWLLAILVVVVIIIIVYILTKKKNPAVIAAAPVAVETL